MEWRELVENFNYKVMLFEVGGCLALTGLGNYLKITVSRAAAKY